MKTLATFFVFLVFFVAVPLKAQISRSAYLVGSDALDEANPAGIGDIISSVNLGWHIRLGATIDQIAADPSTFDEATPGPFDTELIQGNGFFWQGVGIQSTPSITFLSDETNIAGIKTLSRPVTELFIIQTPPGESGDFTAPFDGTNASSTRDYYHTLMAQLRTQPLVARDSWLITNAEALHRATQQIDDLAGIDSMYEADGVTLNAAGRYLSAISIATGLTTQHPVGRPVPSVFDDPSLTPDNVLLLQQIAFDAARMDPFNVIFDVIIPEPSSAALVALMAAAIFWHRGLWATYD